MNKLQAIYKTNKKRITKQLHLSEQLNEQAIHYEVLMRKLKPELLEKRLNSLKDGGKRPDISKLDANYEKNVVGMILKEQGLMSKEQKTFILNEVAYGEHFS